MKKLLVEILVVVTISLSVAWSIGPFYYGLIGFLTAFACGLVTFDQNRSLEWTGGFIATTIALSVGLGILWAALPPVFMYQHVIVERRARAKEE